MKTRIVRIGNSQGIRIPRPLLDQTGRRGEVEINAQDDTLILRPPRRPREGWAASLREMARRGDDTLLDDAAPSLSNWDEDDWTSLRDPLDGDPIGREPGASDGLLAQLEVSSRSAN